MRITYNSPVRSHHYPFAEAINRAGHLYAFISGFSRLSPRSPLPSIGDKLKRHDFLMTMYLGCLKLSIPTWLSREIYRLSNTVIDNASYLWAKDSDFFIYYRTEGYKTTYRLHKENRNTICIMEEVNSHAEYAKHLLKEEFERLHLKETFIDEPDYDLRLKSYYQSDYILCPSEFVKDSFIKKGFPTEKIIKINFGFPTTTKSYCKDFSQDIFRLLFVGQLNYRKGLRYAMEAFRKLKHPRKEFVIVGPKTAITGLEKTRIPANVIFKGILKGEKLNEEYRRASVFILPSIEEGLALVQGEAMSFGVPLLITTNTGGADFIKQGVNGYIVPPQNSHALYEKLQEMADNQELLQSMSESSLRTAKTFGNWDEAVGKLILQLGSLKNKN
jgi:alpha-maltose-1-phosphate synthase